MEETCIFFKNKIHPIDIGRGKPKATRTMALGVGPCFLKEVQSRRWPMEWPKVLG